MGTVTWSLSPLLAPFWIGLVCAAPLLAQDDNKAPSSSPPTIDFNRDIEPIFAAHCYVCHGPKTQESNFRLDVRLIALGTADLGAPPIVPGDISNSPLIRFVSGEDLDFLMPPEGEGDRLLKPQIELLRQWIDEGANWPDDGAEPGETEITTDHWSFQPVVDPPVPEIDTEIAGRFQPANEIDHFIAKGLRNAGLQSSPTADRTTLIRRIYLDLHGLLPTPQQVQRFANDESDDAWTKVIDEVLSSSHYGESWARHWLDIVRFGESTGFEVNRDRSNAFYYRDYVIDALNDDKSFRDFILEQIAGDALDVDEATGFLVGGPYDIVKSPDINLTLMQRQDELADYVNTTSTTFLGLTVGCARCHNHKFDPILQRDYYALQAFFSGVQHGERKLMRSLPEATRAELAEFERQLVSQEALLAELAATAPIEQARADSLLPPVNASMNTDTFPPVEARFVRFSINRCNQSEPCIDELEIFNDKMINVALSSSGSVASSSGNYEGDPKHQLAHVIDGKYGNEFSWIASKATDCWVQIELPSPATIERLVWARDRQGTLNDRLAIDYSISISMDGKEWQMVADSSGRQPFLIDGKEPEGAFIARLSESDADVARKVLGEIQRLRAEIKTRNDSIPSAYVGTFKENETTYRLHRGDPLAPREEVAPDVLTVMKRLGLDSGLPEQERRLKLAKWIASDSNPLTARVIVNRVWQFHFGRGIVATPSDFGVNGARPTHPELLDWLTLRFMESGWSLKWLHRQIMMSTTYRQSSTPVSESLARDADCQMLWRFPPRRLEAEAIRDCILQASGKLNSLAGGPGFLLFRVDRENVHHYFSLDKFEPEHFRRMIYMTKIRQQQEDVFGAFDCPDGGQTIPNRNRSTTPLQSLNLLNSPFMLEQADFLAVRLTELAGADPQAQITMAYNLLLLREPAADELADAVVFVNKFGLSDFCRALLNANEFLFLS